MLKHLRSCVFFTDCNNTIFAGGIKTKKGEFAGFFEKFSPQMPHILSIAPRIRNEHPRLSPSIQTRRGVKGQAFPPEVRRFRAPKGATSRAALLGKVFAEQNPEGGQLAGRVFRPFTWGVWRYTTAASAGKAVLRRPPFLLLRLTDRFELR
jgi:hypothetical protein